MEFGKVDADQNVSVASTSGEEKRIVIKGRFLDKYLQTVSTKKFNARIRELGLQDEEIKKWKLRRRLVKNRKYAECSRHKRTHRALRREEQRRLLRMQVAKMSLKLTRAKRRYIRLKAAYEVLQISMAERRGV